MINTIPAEPVLEITSLDVDYVTTAGPVPAVRGADLVVRAVYDGREAAASIARLLATTTVGATVTA